MKTKILILEKDVYRIRTFIEFLGEYDITITESFREAQLMLSNTMFDYVFLNKDGIEVAKFIQNRLNYKPGIIIHTWDTIVAEGIQRVLPKAKHKLFNTEEFYEINNLL